MNRNRRWIPLALAALVLGAGLPAAASARTLGVEVWTDRGDDAVYQPGDEMRVKVRTSDDAYLLVYEIDSEGRISMLYPWRRGSNLVEGRRTYPLPPEQSDYQLAVERATGEGYIVAIASRRPFRALPWYLRPYDPQAAGLGYEDEHPDEEGFDADGNVIGDPMVAMERIRRRVLDRPSDTDDFASSYASYYVGHEVRYPRYICADCHRPGRWAWWDGFDPYYSRCSVFDFRVNWNWCWGPCIWTGNVPYFFYVVRPDCPPHYRNWYDDRYRWSSWDGHRTWDNLWGGSLTRYKSPPPVGYQAPPPSGKPAWNPNGGNPPGFLPPQGYGTKGGGFREPVPIGQGRWGGVRPNDTPRGSDDTSRRPGARPLPSQRPPRGENPRETPQFEPRREPRQQPRETPQVEPRREPRQDPPRESPRVEPRREPRQDPPRESPRVEPRREPRQDPPRESPRVEPRREPQRQDPPRQQPARPDRGDDGDRGRGRGR